MNSIYGGLGISNFISSIRTRGIAHTNRYEIQFSPRNIGFFNKELLSGMNSRLLEVSLPSSTIASNPHRLQGIDREMPYSKLYEGDLELTFLETTTFDIRNAFTIWQDNMIGRTNYIHRYYDEYICDTITISVIADNSNDIIYSVKLYDCWPKTIDTISFGAEKTDVVETKIKLSFRRWEVDWGSQANKFTGAVNAMKNGLLKLVRR